MSSAVVTFPAFDLSSNMSEIHFKKFLIHCHDNGASDITIQGGDYAWVEKHGRQLKATTTTISQGQISSLIPTVWSADIEANIRGGRGADRALELSGEELGIPRGKQIRFRTNFIQARVSRYSDAFCITMRIIPSELPDITKMCIDKYLFENLYPATGLVLVCGPTGSGKTTLQTGVYTYVGKNYPDRKVITYEDPIEFVLGGSHWNGPQPAQSQIGKDIESFALGLKNAMRRKPSIIGIGEVRDLETVDSIIEAALSGHLTYGTLHTESVAETINRMIQIYPPAQQSAIASRLLGTLRVIIVQRLLKTTDGKRAAIREFIVFDRELKNHIQEYPFEKWGIIIRKILEDSNQTLVDHAWKLFQDESISKEEFIDFAGNKEFRRLSENKQLKEEDIK